MVGFWRLIFYYWHNGLIVLLTLIQFTPISCATTTTAYQKINTQFKITCQTSDSKARFYKYKDLIPFETNTEFHKQTYGFDIFSLSNKLSLEFKKPNITDDGKQIYKVYSSDKPPKVICDYNIYFCDSKEKFSDDLQISIDGQQLSRVNNNSNVTIMNPFNVSISYTYQIKALPLTSSTLSFINITDINVGNNCTQINSNLKCYNTYGFINLNMIEKFVQKKLIIKPNYFISSANYPCDVKYTPSTLLLNLHYLTADITVNNTNDKLKLNDTLKFDYRITYANPEIYYFYLNCIIFYKNGTNATEVQVNKTTSASFSYMFIIKEPFINLSCKYCVNNTVTSRCNSSSFEFDDSSVETSTVSTNVNETTQLSASYISDSTSSRFTDQTSTETSITSTKIMTTNKSTAQSTMLTSSFTSTIQSTSSFTTSQTEIVTISLKPTSIIQELTTNLAMSSLSSYSLTQAQETGEKGNSQKSVGPGAAIAGSISGVVLVIIIICIVVIIVVKRKRIKNDKENEKISDKIPLSDTNRYKSISMKHNPQNNKPISKPIKREILDNELYGLPESPKASRHSLLNKTTANKSTSNTDNNIYNLTDDQINTLCTSATKSSHQQLEKVNKTEQPVTYENQPDYEQV